MLHPWRLRTTVVLGSVMLAFIAAGADVTVRSADAQCASATLQLLPYDSDGQRQAGPAVDFDPRARLPEPPAGSTWRLRAVAAGCWSEEVVLDGGGSARAVRVWPAARLQTRLRTGRRAAPLIPRLEIRSGPAWSEAPLAGHASCEASDDDVVCVIPAGVPLDLRFDLPGYAPAYLFDVAATPGRTVQIEEQLLQPGASVSGYVRAADGQALAGARIRLVPQARSSSDQRAPLRTMTSRTNARGFFQISGVPEGLYELESEKPGLPVLRRPRIHVRPGEEYVFPAALVQRPPQRVELWIAPHADAVGRSWRATLQQRGPAAAQRPAAASGTADARGFWSAEALESGEYMLLIEDADGNLRARRAVTLEDDLEVVAVEIDSVAVRGRVHAKDGVASDLMFRGPTGAVVKIATDEDGVFAGVLPGEGLWRVNVIEKSRAMSLRREYRIRRADADASGAVYLDIALPEGVVSGRVTDAEGRKISSGTVLVIRNHTEVAQARIADGEFSAVGIEPGPALIRAYEREVGQSDAMPVEVTKDTAGVTLIFRKHRRVHGVVATRDGKGVAGAIVRFLGPSFYDAAEAVSAAGGTFVATVPDAHTPVSVAVLPGIYPVRLFALPRLPLGPLELTVGGPGGVLRVLPHEREWPVVRNGSAPFSVVSLMYPPDGAPQRRGLSNRGLELELEAGEYTLCAEALMRCRNVAVPPHGTASVNFSGDGP